MNSSSNPETRRCRPFLGTLVEVGVADATPTQMQVAISKAFAAVERVQRLMSFYDPKSEISKLNQWGVREPVRVSRWTYQILAMAKQLHLDSDGVFDIAVAPELMKWGMLPCHLTFSSKVEPYGRTNEIELSAGQWVRFRRPLIIDLGGIAKGFAVDRAIEALQACGIKAGIVNAGGDLRCFGQRAQKVWVRHPKSPGTLLPFPALKNSALATSANFYQRHRYSGKDVCAQIHGRTRLPCLRAFSVSVCSKTCMIADAFTKVILALGKAAPSLQSKYDVIAYILGADGRINSVKDGRI